jgi:hypothetical protein
LEEVHESVTANLRIDAFNALNHTQWNGVDTTWNGVTGGTFGMATGAREARITQISFKLSF